MKNGFVNVSASMQDKVKRYGHFKTLFYMNGIYSFLGRTNVVSNNQETLYQRIFVHYDTALLPIHAFVDLRDF